MDLSGSWSYLIAVAAHRLAHNKTPRHVYRYGTEIELQGAAGELAARRFLGLPEILHESFDHGVDIYWHGLTIDVKTTQLTPKLQHRYLQWPAWKLVKAKIVLMAAVDLINKQATIIGFTYPQVITQAPINATREIPCYEIPVAELEPPWKLEILFANSEVR